LKLVNVAVALLHRGIVS